MYKMSTFFGVVKAFKKTLLLNICRDILNNYLASRLILVNF